MTSDRQLFPVSKKVLLYLAASVWGWAGAMLLQKGGLMLLSSVSHTACVYATALFSLTGGIVFYRAMFAQLSQKHIHRIHHLPQSKPPIYAFFSPKSYLLMTFMIGMGVAIRRYNVIDPYYLCIIYLTMGTPLFIAALRLLKAGIGYKKRE